MVIWKGWGILVLIITFLSSLVAELVSESIFKDHNYYQEHTAPLAIALLTAGIITATIGRRLNNKNTKIFIEKETGKEIIVKPDHSLFLIPMEYWGIILVFGAVLFSIFKSIYFI